MIGKTCVDFLNIKRVSILGDYDVGLGDKGVDSKAKGLIVSPCPDKLHLLPLPLICNTEDVEVLKELGDIGLPHAPSEAF